jgi:acyl-CoA thioesterase
MPVVAAPEECDLTDRWASRHDDLHGQIEVRVAQGRHARVDGFQRPSDDGRMILWIRPRRGQAVDSAMLAIMADHVPSGVAHALGLEAGGNSLDNTIRFRRVVPTDWVLCDITIHGVHGGFAHGAMRLFAQNGELMAMASQSMILRLRDGRSRQSEAG